LNPLFFIIYTIVVTLLYIVSIPFLILFALRSKYSKSIPARFFLWRNRPLRADGVWFHACSFGEMRALSGLRESLPGDILRFSSITQTGFDEGSLYSQESRFLPFEPLLLFWIKPQKALVVMEAELWCLLFALAHKRGAKTLLINARISERSYQKYLKMRWFYAQIFACIDEVYAQTYQDKERLESLGAKRVEVTGNIKLASLSKPNKAIPKPKGTIVCAASTHDGEEVLALQAFSSLSDQEPEAKLLIVPRHPERFAKVGSVIQKFASEHGWSYSRYSEDDKLDTKVVLVDKLGELVNIYTISDIVVLGGAFVPAGGHNAAEAAQFGCKIISGEHYFNQKDIFDAVDGIKIVQEHELDWWLLEHQTLPNTSLRMRSDITPIVESINHVLSH